MSYVDYINIDIKNNNDISNICKNQIISMIVDNARNLGWAVESKKNSKKKVLILRKKIDKLTKNEKNTEKLVDLICDIRNF
jgi:hypothetical protein